MMKQFSVLTTILIVSALLFSCGSAKKKTPVYDQAAHIRGAVNHHSGMPFDSSLLLAFYHNYPDLSGYSEDVREVYRRHNFTHIWFDEKGIIEFGQTLYSKVTALDEEGIHTSFPYESKLEEIFETNRDLTLTPVETELMLTNLYLFYADKVITGLADTTVRALGWLLPKKELSYTAILDSLMADTLRIERDDSLMFDQYYRLKEVLRKYREISRKGGWKPIEIKQGFKAFKPGDSSAAIAKIRERLFLTGDIGQNSGSQVFDPELVEAVRRFQQRTGKNPTDKILPEHIREMNIPVDLLITRILVNMERCRWIPPGYLNKGEYIVVNIPAFRLTYVKDSAVELTSPVIVGKSMTKTLVFSGMMSYIVFSPYWNVPVSIINKEIKPGMKRDPGYLDKHNMEWNNGQVRQKPGKNNSLGLVKFIFPNSNDIYMHDTPAKSLFERERRDFSHGCIRVGKPRDLAIAILKDDPAWTPAKIDAAMKGGKEQSYSLKKKIPVYIGYLTTWVDADGVINFYDDVYSRDARLAELLIGQ